jgi:hypothetical protein
MRNALVLDFPILEVSVSSHAGGSSTVVLGSVRTPDDFSSALKVYGAAVGCAAAWGELLTLLPLACAVSWLAAASKRGGA